MNIKQLTVTIISIFTSIIFTSYCYTKISWLPNYYEKIDSIVETKQLIIKDNPFHGKINLTRFNLIQSDYLPLYRSTGDHRNHQCKLKQYNSTKLPTASVIIVFHNEQWSTLLRTIKTLINKSPDNLIEILLIDDLSTTNSIKYHLKSYLISTLKNNKVKLVRSTSRIGLISGRNYGASIAIGQIIVFLDSHVEVNSGWLEPLLDRLAQNRKRVVSPIVDLINPEDFSYHPVPENYMSGFTWSLTNFMIPLKASEIEKRKIDPTRVIKSPTTYGGIFAISKSFFLELGGHDSEMKFFSFESIDLSLWIWSCGGEIEIVPCSRLGHVHSPSSVTFPMKKETIYLHNSGRIVEIWLKKYRMFFYLLFPLVASVDRGNLYNRKSHQTKLECKNITWYFETVYPSTPFPFAYRSIGQIEHTPTMLCFHYSFSSDQQSRFVNLKPCRLNHGNDLTYFRQIFIHTDIGTIRNDNWCLTGNVDYEQLTFTVCNSIDYSDSQIWIYSKKSQSINHKLTNRCIHLPINSNQPILHQCNTSILEQKFFLRDNLDWDDGNRIIK
ncbi:polypeptide N-acetylgalactosaminyltransferase 5-like [Panonychus citri]|uniref:polypeptide N-acetylgalactosaminyltransferase 5-like n=1 Tax=Panonychus citri TaxID=50023 RepID=UPI002307886F|nr:polypeptide N-acetylgalactosaminyltransferase 5-like [Panonychus citri]